MKCLLITFIFVGVATCDYWGDPDGLVDYRVLLREARSQEMTENPNPSEDPSQDPPASLTTPATDDPSRECSSPGLMCESCKSLVLCVEENGNYVKHPVETCDGGSTCFGSECSTAPNYACQATDYTFDCNTMGMFPDPFNCQKFYFCVPEGADPKKLTKSEVKCNADWTYNAATTYCDKKLVSGRCYSQPNKYPVPECKKAGQIGPLDQNKSIYYICVKKGSAYYPKLYACPNGGVFNKNHCQNK